MAFDCVASIYFSPAGTTQKTIEQINIGIPGPKLSYDLLRQPLTNDVALSEKSLAIVALPVYSGRIPQICQASLAHLKGSDTPALAVVVYGNRDYDDALLELKNTLENTGFKVMAAAAFVARHSIFPVVAANRPDQSDMELMHDFTRQALAKLNSPEKTNLSPLLVKGKLPYKEPSPASLYPSADPQTCTLCGQCADICPTKAIDKTNPLQKDQNLCLACTACIAVCPENSQAFRGPQYEALRQKFKEANSARKEPEIFL